MRGIEIRGVDVSFQHRDIKHVNDTEYREIKALIEDEIRRTHGTLASLVILTDHVRYNCRYVVFTTHEERDDEAELPGGEDDR